MLPTSKRKGVTVSFGEALGAKDENADLVLNTFEQATCQTCGAEPKLHTSQTPKGRTVVLWMALPHACRMSQ